MQRARNMRRGKPANRRLARLPARDPPHMHTSRVSGPVDPPQTCASVMGVKRLRKKVQLAAGNATLTLNDILNCLPFATDATFSTFIRILKLSVWGSAGPNSLVAVNFPLHLNGLPADSTEWVDEGTQGSIRPQVHLAPNFAYRSTWLTAGSVNNVALFAGTATDLLVVDITVEYKTVKQGCPS